MIKTRDLTKTYSERLVLDSINIDIKDSEILSIMGPSGTGKSTLLKCLVSLIKPDSGQILIDGVDIVSIKDELRLQNIRKKFGYLFQEGALFDSLNVFENVAFGLKYLTDTKQNEYLDIVKKTLSLVGLKDCEYMKISELSGGMKKRVALARAIAFKPSYLLYDEPTTGLDPITTDMVIDMIKDMKAKLGITTVVVTHDVKLAFTVSDRIAFLNKGKFIEMGSKDEIKNSKNSMVKEFINNTQMA